MSNNTNTYKLRTEEINGNIRYFVSFKDFYGVLQEVEVPTDVYLAFETSLREDDSLERWNRRRVEYAELTEAELYNRALSKPKSVEDEVLDNIRNEKLKQVISELPEIMRRRFILYHDYGLTLKQIGEVEGCSFQVVARSIKSAENKIKKFFENWG